MSADALYRAVRRLVAGGASAPDVIDLTEEEGDLLQHLTEERSAGILGFEAGALFATLCYLSGRISAAARAECDPQTWLDGLVSHWPDDPEIADGFDGLETHEFGPGVYTPAPTVDGEHATLAATYEVVADLLLEPEHLAAFRADPAVYARRRLTDPSAQHMIAGLEPAALRRAGNHSARFLQQFGEGDADSDQQKPTSDVLYGAQAGPSGAPLRPLARPTRQRPLIGCTWREDLAPVLFDHFDLIDIWEWYIEQFAGDDLGRSGARALAAIAMTRPVSLHSLSLSLGSPNCLDNRGWFAIARRLVRASGVRYVSDHLGLQLVGDRRVPHFVPVWRTDEQLKLVTDNVAAVQELIDARVVIENATSMVDLGGEIGTAAFLSEVAHRTGCGILLDLENVRVNAANGLIDGDQELADFDLNAVVEIHVAGARRRPGETWALDSHDARLHGTVLAWLERLLPHMPACEAIILERDQRMRGATDVVEDLRRLRQLVA